MRLHFIPPTHHQNAADAGGHVACKIAAVFCRSWWSWRHLKNGLFSGEFLPAPHGHIDILRAELHRKTTPSGLLCGDDGGSAAAEWFINGIAWRGVVFDWSAHALDRLLRSVSVTTILARRNAPQR